MFIYTCIGMVSNRQPNAADSDTIDRYSFVYIRTSELEIYGCVQTVQEEKDNFLKRNSGLLIPSYQKIDK